MYQIKEFKYIYSHTVLINYNFEVLLSIFVSVFWFYFDYFSY